LTLALGDFLLDSSRKLKHVKEIGRQLKHPKLDTKDPVDTHPSRVASPI
jgi:hypothetical protein